MPETGKTRPPTPEGAFAGSGQQTLLSPGGVSRVIRRCSGDSSPTRGASAKPCMPAGPGKEHTGAAGGEGVWGEGGQPVALTTAVLAAAARYRRRIAALRGLTVDDERREAALQRRHFGREHRAPDDDEAVQAGKPLRKRAQMLLMHRSSAG
eukprot:240341-Chlamydomonas_euryale.AAC.10